MPELPYAEKEIMDSAKEFAKEDERFYEKNGYRCLPDQKILEIIDGKDLKLIGRGAECVVLARTEPQKRTFFWNRNKEPANSDDLVIAIDYREFKDPIKAKRIFYFHRIVSTLFPHNFPKFVTSFSVNSEGSTVSGSVRKRVDIRSCAKKEYGSDLDENSKYPFSDVLKTVGTLQLPVYFDSASLNYGITKEGGVNYLDKVVTSPRIDQPAADRVKTWMKDNKYKEDQIRLVTSSISRINALQDEQERLNSQKRALAV